MDIDQEIIEGIAMGLHIEAFMQLHHLTLETGAQGPLFTQEQIAIMEGFCPLENGDWSDTVPETPPAAYTLARRIWEKCSTELKTYAFMAVDVSSNKEETARRFGANLATTALGIGVIEGEEGDAGLYVGTEEGFEEGWGDILLPAGSGAGDGTAQAVLKLPAATGLGDTFNYGYGYDWNEFGVFAEFVDEDTATPDGSNEPLRYETLCWTLDKTNGFMPVQGSSWQD